MLSALHAYKLEQPALDSVQPRHPRQLQPQCCINPEAVFKVREQHARLSVCWWFHFK
jgi:hypothetical protein